MLNSNPAYLRQLGGNIERAWRELIAYGHELSRVDIGIWDGSRTYEIRFLANDQVIETMEAYLATVADFDALRARIKTLRKETQSWPAGC
jgi:hypothetical protein